MTPPRLEITQHKSKQLEDKHQFNPEKLVKGTFLLGTNHQERKGSVSRTGLHSGESRNKLSSPWRGVTQCHAVGLLRLKNSADLL